MTIFENLSALQQSLTAAIDLSQEKPVILDKNLLQQGAIDELVYTATFSNDTDTKEYARKVIHELAREMNVYPASINNLYFAIGKGEVSGFTVPAINVRIMNYDTARIIFKLMIKHSIGAIIFEIARSEMQYTGQEPIEFTTSILAAAIKEGYDGPVFLQGDHYQFSPAKFAEDATAETNRLKELIQKSIAAGFYNIDIDASTLVDLSKPDLNDQQFNNYTKSAELTRYIRNIEPKDVTISIGGEIGHIGGVNSTVGDFKAFMDGYWKELQGETIVGMSKASVQTGTSHGGIPLPRGKVAEVKLDFNVLKDIGTVARQEYGMGGAVQHGASTLPNELFDQFPKYGTLEIHLATGFQNIVYEHMPADLKEKIYEWVRKNTQSEWKASDTEEQNIYKTRKKATGQFKKELWTMSDAEKEPIRKGLQAQIEHLFTKLNVINTKDVVEQHAIYSKDAVAHVVGHNGSSDDKVDDLSD